MWAFERSWLKRGKRVEWRGLGTNSKPITTSISSKSDGSEIIYYSFIGNLKWYYVIHKIIDFSTSYSQTRKNTRENSEARRLPSPLKFTNSSRSCPACQLWNAGLAWSWDSDGRTGPFEWDVSELQIHLLCPQKSCRLAFHVSERDGLRLESMIASRRCF